MEKGNSNLGSASKLKSKDEQFLNKIREDFEEKSSEEYVEFLQNELYKIINFKEDQENLMKFKEDLKIFITNENSLLLEENPNSNFPRNFEDLDKYLLSLQEKQEKLFKKENELKNLISNFHDTLRNYVTKHNYFDPDNEISTNLGTNFVKYFHQGVIEMFYDNEGCSLKLDKLVYNRTDVYRGQKKTKKNEGEKYFKYRDGFGYYENFTPGDDEERANYFGTFIEDEYHKGILNYDFDGRNPYFNGEFSNDKKTFNGTYLIREKGKVDTFFMLLGKLDISSKNFSGIFIKKDLKDTNIYYGDINDGKKNSKDSIFIQIEESNRTLQNNGMKYKIFFGDFENDLPIYQEENDNPLYGIENSLFYKLHNGKNFVFFNHETEKDIISQGFIINERLEGKGFISDMKKNIIYEGEFKNGQYEGKGNFINYEYSEENLNQNKVFNKIILLRGLFSSTGITDGFLNFFEIKNQQEYLNYVEKADLTPNFDLKYGKIYLEENETYEGEFKDFQKSGKGVYIYSDGSSYTGNWLNDKKEGDGIYKDKSNNEYNRKWRNDEMIRKKI
jgi:hypothetical protein